LIRAASFEALERSRRRRTWLQPPCGGAEARASDLPERARAPDKGEQGALSPPRASWSFV
jgi:hypothetical protein